MGISTIVVQQITRGESLGFVGGDSSPSNYPGHGSLFGLVELRSKKGKMSTSSGETSSRYGDVANMFSQDIFIGGDIMNKSMFTCGHQLTWAFDQ